MACCRASILRGQCCPFPDLASRANHGNAGCWFAFASGVVCSPAGRRRQRPRQRVGRAYTVLRDACGRAIDVIRRSVFVADSCDGRLNLENHCQDSNMRKGGREGVESRREGVLPSCAAHLGSPPTSRFNPAFCVLPLPSSHPSAFAVGLQKA